jgi:hypothetical protein
MNSKNDLKIRGFHSTAEQQPREKSQPRMDANGAHFWWGEAPEWPENLNEATGVAQPKVQLGRHARRAAVYHVNTVQTRGSAHKPV